MDWKENKNEKVMMNESGNPYEGVSQDVNSLPVHLHHILQLFYDFVHGWTSLRILLPHAFYEVHNLRTPVFPQTMN